jgi:hypothetical protein
MACLLQAETWETRSREAANGLTSTIDHTTIQSSTGARPWALYAGRKGRTVKTIKNLREAIESEKAQSAWDKGVKEYALELIEEWDDEREFYGSPADRKDLLNGADDWKQYSWGGCALIYNSDIAKRLSSPSELKKTRDGERRPNASEEWLDTQARALYQASNLIVRLAKA